MAGHYLSAASRMAVATGDNSFREKANYMVAELAKCRDALKQDGYLAAFPAGAFDQLEGKPGDSAGVVVPYYTIHKIMAGLLDAHLYLGNKPCARRGRKMADYFEKRLAALNAEQIEIMFLHRWQPQSAERIRRDERRAGGTLRNHRRQKHLAAAKVFNRPWSVGPLAKGEDRLAGLHANTHIAQCWASPTAPISPATRTNSGVRELLADCDAPAFL